MPLGLTIPDGDAAIEALANGDPGPPRGRELELAGLLAQLRAGGVRNLVFVTADVHYTAAHRYDPARAIFSAFNQEWIEQVVRAMRRRQGAAGPTARDIRRRAYALGGMVDQYLAAIYLYEDRHVVATAGSIKEVVATLTAIWCRAFADILPADEIGPAAR